MHWKLPCRTAAGLLLAGVLAACGGGGGDSTTATSTPPAPTTFAVSGTAATGAVFSNATITIVASDGTIYGGTAADVTAADGTYTITLPIAAKPPFVVKAARDDQTLVSVVPEAKDSTANVTPVTTLIASRLSASGDPTKLADEIKNKTVTVDTTAVKAKVAEVVALIKPVMDAVGDTTDPLNGKLVADGSGADKVLDSLSITITPSSTATVNIEVAVKQKLASGANPTVVAFTGGANATAPATALPSVTAGDLVPSGTTPMIADLLKRITACYALPVTTRVNTTAKTAADIVAAECKTIFSGDDPSKYKQNGSVVSSSGQFAGIFNANGNNVVFDRGNYEYTRANGDIVFSFRSTDSSGNVNNGLLVAVSEGTPAKLKLIGNQYVYSGGVNAYQQYREFINQPDASYYSTGYNLSVNNQLDASGNPIFNRVEVTTPKGNTIVLKPTAGNSFLDLTQNGKLLGGTSFVRLRSVYADATNKGDPGTSSDNTSLFFASPTWGEGEVSSIPAQSVWTFNYFLAGNTGTTADAVQTYRTIARAMTIGEIKAQSLANATDALIADIKASTKTNPNVATSGWVDTPTTGPIGPIEWTVSNTALPPTQVKVWGKITVGSGTAAKTVGFDDNVNFLPSARKASVSCSKATSTDPHCDASGNFAAGATAHSFHLWAQDSRLRQFAHFYAIYKITM